MRVIRPSTMSEALLLSENVSETLPAWSSTTNYVVGNKVHYINGGIHHGVYTSVTSNINKPPNLNDGDWVREGPTNTYAMFDSQISTQTTGVTDITAEVLTGETDSVALLNLVGASVTVTVTDPAAAVNPVYTSTQSLQGSTMLDWFDYFFFDPSDQRTQAIFLGIPISSATARTAFTVSAAPGAPVAIGSFVFGRISELGKTNYGLSAGVIDYSVKETDQYGVTTFIVRDYSKRLTADIQINNIDLNRVQRTLYALRAKPAVWLATEDARYEETSIVYGFYRDFSVSIAYPTHSTCSLEIEGLI